WWRRGRSPAACRVAGGVSGSTSRDYACRSAHAPPDGGSG
ncbi:MAG: hypothetical protein AVDCRST_MAG70-1973, partial [uncultured Thermomicrobiales bacterium]